MKISVIQTEHLLNDPASLGCLLFINDSLVDIITPLSAQNPENNTEVPTSGKIEFVIKDMRKDLILGTYTSEISNLKSDEWLCLNSNLKPSPRIQVTFNGLISKSLNQVSTSNTTDLINKIRELSTTVLELECKLGIEKEEKNKEISHKSQMLHELQIGSELTLEQLKIKLQSSFRAIQELSKQKENLIKLCEQEHLKVENLVTRLEESSQYSEKVCQGMASGSFKYIEENSQLQREISELRIQMDQVKLENTLKDRRIKELEMKTDIGKNEQGFSNSERFESLNSRLGEAQKQIKILMELDVLDKESIKECDICKLKQMEIERCNDSIKELKIQLSNFKDQSGFIQYLQEHSFTQDSEISRLQEDIIEKSCLISTLSQELSQEKSSKYVLQDENKEIVQECSELKQRILSLTRTTEILEREFTNLKCKNISARKVEKVKLDEIDHQLEQYLFQQGIENLFVKMAHGVYLYGTKRVNISLKKDNRLICRTGGGYTPIDQFLKLYQNTEVEEISKYVKKQSLFLSQGSSPIRSHKRAISITPESRKTSPKENKTDRNLEKKILDKLTVVYPLKERNFTPMSRNSKLF